MTMDLGEQEGARAQEFALLGLIFDIVREFLCCQVDRLLSLNHSTRELLRRTPAFCAVLLPEQDRSVVFDLCEDE